MFVKQEQKNDAYAVFWIAVVLVVVWPPLALLAEYLRDCDISINNETVGAFDGTRTMDRYHVIQTKVNLTHVRRNS